MADGPGPLRIRSDGVHPTSDTASYDDAADPANGHYLWAGALIGVLTAAGVTA